MSKRHRIPESSIWFSLRRLKNLGILDYGGFITLTEEGEVIAKIIK